MNRLREFRQQEDWSQEQLVVEMERVARQLRLPLSARRSMITNLSRWENGKIRPGPEYLHVLRQVFACTDVDLGFDDETEAWSLPALPSQDPVAYFEGLFLQHVAADNQLGSAFVGPVVADQTRHLAELAATARGPTRRPLIEITARYEELLGWLNQDAGRVEAAMRHTDRARDLAIELNDSIWNAYLLMRKSNIAFDAGNGPLALALSDAALSSGTGAARDIRAVILRQKANAHALLGEVDACDKAIDDALEALAHDPQGERELAPYCTLEYVSMDAGKCWVLLGDHKRALTAFERAATPLTMPSQRDHGLALARTAHAHALAGERETACSTAILALRAARVARSARVMRELRALRAALRKRWPRDERSRAIVDSVGRLVGDG